jgi:hypothetical protein
VFRNIVAMGDVFFDGAATLDYDPGILGVEVLEPDVSITLSEDLSMGFLTLFDFDPTLDGSLLDTLLTVDNGIRDDSFSMLFASNTGPTPFAVATFTGDLDGFGFANFSTDGVRFGDINLEVTSATVIPLPAGILLLGTGLAGLCLIRTRRRTNG